MTGWEFWIDRGGTFTDCIGLAPDGRLHTAKLLSSDEAAAAGIRKILERAGEIAAGDPLPPCGVKLGTTVATNALLERRGTRTLLVTNRGLSDLFRIGTQERPELFQLAIEKPAPLHAQAVEVSGRIGVEGDEVEPFDEAAAREALRAAREAGLEAVAIVMIHAYRDPDLEARLAALAREVGLAYVVTSHEIAREIGLLARGETTIADAYLTPLLRRYIDRVGDALPGSRLRFMQSSGGLTEGRHFRGPGALLSGPAGGVVGAARVATRAGFRGAIGFDMGGTSTDVSLIVDGEVERHFETRVAGVRVKAPMLRIHTVAAGGGSLCRFDGFRLTVGPESAGADPGPLCYGRETARELALTDVNLFLGRIQGERFPLPLHPERVDPAFTDLQRLLRSAGHALEPDEIAAGFVTIANAHMAQAIQEVSVARGVDPRDFALVGFGGAGGQHVCAIARQLGIRRVLLHPLAGLLSAYGIGLADVTCDRQHDAGRIELPEDGALPTPVQKLLAELEAEARGVLEAEGIAAATVRVERLLDLRYRGTETALAMVEPPESAKSAASGQGGYARAFSAEHRARFGYLRPGHPIEIVTARVRCRAPGTALPENAQPQARSSGDPQPLARSRIWFEGSGRIETPVYDRSLLGAGAELEGPALILEDTGTVVLEPGFRAELDADGVLRLTDEAPTVQAHAEDLSRKDPVRLEVFGSRFMSIAEQMGAVLRNTSVSTNIKERLDYSCAVFDAEGGLVANAPHIPVHLGAMGETVRAVRDAFPDLVSGDVVATNDPASGGSHLPDVTVVTPVFMEEERAPRFFVASRGHHADLGGKTPGSMPADSTSLEEEGVLLRPFRLVREGRIDEQAVRSALLGARFPARNPDDNVADLEAMVAANRAGERLLRDFVAERGREAVEVTMAQLQEAAAGKVAREIGRLPDGEHVFEDHLDDGTPVRVRLRVEGERMEIDFDGTGPAVTGNLNAPRAVVQAAVIYVLRCLVAERIPLNGGCLAPVTIRVPAGSLLDPPAGAAVAGGNVETSQRIVDVLLGAIGRVAASQGTMNNVTFGNERFGYYETVGGGAGAGEGFDGESAVHTHMTNTRITDAEVLEDRYPVRLARFSIRPESGGAGRWRGGDGVVRAYEFLAPVTVSLLTERRVYAPYGLEGGEPGKKGRNRIERADGAVEELGGKATVQANPGDRLVVETPGGGGFGRPV